MFAKFQSEQNEIQNQGCEFPPPILMCKVKFHAKSAIEIDRMVRSRVQIVKLDCGGSSAVKGAL